MERCLADKQRPVASLWIYLTAISALAAIATSARAAVIHVPGDVASIQSAIASANSGDEVLVAPGTYFENIDFLGKAVSVVSEAGAAVTVVDGSNTASVVVFRSSETSGSVLDGFTIQHGYGSFDSQYSGGGIYISDASPTVRNNIVVSNNASSGSGIAVQFASPLITHNTVANNSGGDSAVYVGGAANARLIGNSIVNNAGTGIELFAAGTPTIVGNRISGNSGGQGGGMTAYNYADAYVANNLIVGNSASQGGGVYVLVPSGNNGPTFVNNTLADNFANVGSDVYLGGFDNLLVMTNNIIASSAGSSGVECDPLYQPASPLFSHNDVFSSNGATIAGSCAGLLGGNGNISANPKFAGGTGPDRYALTAGSPAIDAGDNGATGNESTDLPGNTRIVDGNSDGAAIVDIGAYEFASGPGVPAAPTLSLSANFASATLGFSITLQWASFNADSCVASGAWSGGEALGGSLQVEIVKTGKNVFTLACTGAGGTVTKSVTVKGVLPEIGFIQAAEQTPKGDSRGRSTTDIFIGFPLIIRTITVPFTVSSSDPALRYNVTPSGTLTIPVGATSPAKITINVTSPAYLQCERSIVVTLGTPHNATLGPISTNTLTVHNYALPGVCKATGH